MKKEKLVITRRGDDGFSNFSIRVPKEIVQKLDDLANKTNRSRNELIIRMLEFGIKNCEIV